MAGKPNPLLSRHKKPRGAGELAVRTGRWGTGPWEVSGRVEKTMSSVPLRGQVGFAGPTSDPLLASLPAAGHADFLQGAAQISGRRPAPQPPGGGCGDGSGCRLPAVPAPSSCRASSSGTADHPPSTPPRSRTHPNCARSHPLLPVLTSTLTPPIQPPASSRDPSLGLPARPSSRRSLNDLSFHPHPEIRGSRKGEG